MLNQARWRTDIEWIHGDLTSIGWDREFDLVVMTGHAFQEYTKDDEIRVALAATRSALTDGGRFAFETRNPLDRAWERWPNQYSGEATDATGAVVQCAYQVQQPVMGGVVRTQSTFTSPAWDHPEVSKGALRFIDAATLSAFLVGTGFVVEEQFGNWNREPLTETSPEIITIARKG
jgi:hypothetical protein